LFEQIIDMVKKVDGMKTDESSDNFRVKSLKLEK